MSVPNYKILLQVLAGKWIYWISNIIGRSPTIWLVCFLLKVMNSVQTFCFCFCCQYSLYPLPGILKITISVVLFQKVSCYTKTCGELQVIHGTYFFCSLANKIYFFLWLFVSSSLFRIGGNTFNNNGPKYPPRNFPFETCQTSRILLVHHLQI